MSQEVLERPAEPVDSWLPSQIKHLDYAQAAITRMAQNSFLLKGWALTLVAAVVAIVAKDGKLIYVGLALLPAGVFWGLDGYFLWQERLFRKLYEAAIQPAGVETLPRPPQFSLDARPYLKHVASWRRTVGSPTLVWFYASLFVGIGAVVVVLYFSPPAPPATSQPLGCATSTAPPPSLVGNAPVAMPAPVVQTMPDLGSTDAATATTPVHQNSPSDAH